MTIVMPVLAAVRCSSPTMALRTSSGKRERSPMVRMRTLFFMKSSSSIAVKMSDMSAATSCGGRFQFSVENVYSVRYLMPKFEATVVISRTVSTPCWCPMLRFSPRALAHRPFPSMMIATCCGNLRPVVSPPFSAAVETQFPVSPWGFSFV